VAIKIVAGAVVTANERMDVWQPGYVIVDAGRIVEAGPGTGPAGDFSECVEEPFGIVMPGLVNAHAHSPSNLLKGTFSCLPLEIWRQYIRAGWREYSDEAIYVSAQLGVVEMIRTGCTAVLDHFYTGSTSPYMGALQAVDAMEQAGMRGALALTLSDSRYEDTVDIGTAGLSPGARDEIDRISQLEGATTLEDFVEFAHEVRKRSTLVAPIVGPSAPHRCSNDLLVQCMETAVELDTTVHIHVCETKGQFFQGLKLFGKSVVGHLDELGVLNERLSMAHCVWLTDSDIELAAKRGTVIVHNPASNGKLGSGRMRFDEMIQRGVRVGLATDGAGSNDTQNMFEAMRFAAAWHNHNDVDYRDWPSPEQVLRAATSTSAQALGLGGKLGSIGPGKLADLVLLTMNSFPFSPLNNVVNQLVYCENGMSVRSVMIDGRWVMRGGEVLTLDEAALYGRARELRAEMEDRLQLQFAQTAEIEPALRDAYLRGRQTAWSKDAIY
jgi:5-methylthioadenosine/S-adenosylhomocysteine deaminase